MVRLAVPEVRVRMHIERNGGNGRMSLQESPYDSMHPVHDPAVDSEDDRMGQVDLSF